MPLQTIRSPLGLSKLALLVELLDGVAGVSMMLVCSESEFSEPE
jgi:hypothetical protein